MDDQKQAKSLDPGPHPHSAIPRSIYPQPTRQSYGDQLSSVSPQRQEYSRSEKRIRERILSLSWLATAMLAFGLLTLVIVLSNSHEFENYLLPRSYQVICCVTAVLYVAGAATLLVTKSVHFARALAIALRIGFVVNILSTVYTVLTHFTVSIASGPNVAIALAAYFLGSMYFAFSTWSLTHELEDVSEESA